MTTVKQLWYNDSMSTENSRDLDPDVTQRLFDAASAGGLSPVRAICLLAVAVTDNNSGASDLLRVCADAIENGAIAISVNKEQQVH